MMMMVWPKHSVKSFRAHARSRIRGRFLRYHTVYTMQQCSGHIHSHSLRTHNGCGLEILLVGSI